MKPTSEIALMLIACIPWPVYGWMLVDLIRKAIRPEYWDTAGGPGNAIDYGPSRALVIHGSWRIQEDAADLLGALSNEREISVRYLLRGTRPSGALHKRYLTLFSRRS